MFTYFKISINYIIVNYVLIYFYKNEINFNKSIDFVSSYGIIYIVRR